MQLIGYAYPWDLTEDPRRRDRVLGLGLHAVAVAGAYHAVRAATPSHPRHRTKDARHAAFYRPVRRDRFGVLVPAEPSWTEQRDAFGEAVRTLHENGTRALAWTVLSHSSEIGRRHPDHTVVNAFGERYPWALCTSSRDVVELAAALVRELGEGLPLDGYVLEAVGHLGFTHGGLHDKTMAYSALEATLLSICFAPACRELRGGDDEELRTAVRAALDPATARPAADLAPTDLTGALGPELEGRLAAARAVAVGRTCAALAEVVHGEVWAHGDPDVHATGAFTAATPELQRLADGHVVAAAWGSLESIGPAVAALSSQPHLGAYLTVLEPGSPPLAEQVTRAAEAGASTVHLYHLGLCTDRHLDEIAEVAQGLS
ncbi:hypothetical protein DT076_17555 [Desertihabitans brevis]|uniref:Uncharacterized protein n=1 Tax=Desertihabitans brevis TaxID=2268447 RepID=A0A367YR20_9ACTN|nr:hypothetical protein [Desertihabitans brevis]RCK68187.1 hypothetical protein DT076_17555 [Desertihabitans brevis]